MALNITNLYALGGPSSEQRHDALVDAGLAASSDGLVATFGPVVTLLGHNLSNTMIATLSADLPGCAIVAAQSFEGRAAQATAFADGEEQATAIFGHTSWLALASQFNQMIAADPTVAAARGWEPMVIPQERLSGTEWWLTRGYGMDDNADLEVLVADGAPAEGSLVTLLDAIGVSEFLTMLTPDMVHPGEVALNPDSVTRLSSPTERR